MDALTPGNTQKLPDNPELANLKERETVLIAEIARLEKLNANVYSVGGHDLNEVRRREQSHLAEIRKAIAEATK